jgi:hypothetical protein
MPGSLALFLLFIGFASGAVAMAFMIGCHSSRHPRIRK